MVEIVGKLTAKSLGWDRNAIGNATSDTTVKQKMGTIAGIVSGLRQTVNNETGDIQTGLKGNFRGVSTLTAKVIEKNADGTDKMKDGKPVVRDTGTPIEVRSGVCYLPAGLQDMIEGSLAQAQEHDPKATVSFALDLYAIKDTNKAGYTFRAETLVQPDERDPLDMLMDQANDARAALPAPETDSDGDGDNLPSGEPEATAKRGGKAS